MFIARMSLKTASNLKKHGVSFDEARAALLVAKGDTTAAVRLVAAALAAAPPGNAGWLIPIDPLLGVSRAPKA